MPIVFFLGAAALSVLSVFVGVLGVILVLWCFFGALAFWWRWCWCWWLC